MSLKEKVDGNELDLSLNQLTEVPVKELAAATKATLLDISCNRIQTLPREFSTLTHLVKIDLANNRLTDLPENFGNLHNLQYLDLYSNQLVTLPVSFCRLKNLRWLDLKNNPLENKLKSVAGDCLDEKECQACAKKVVAYMQGIDSELEREKQKKLKAAREREAIEREKVEKELEEQRRVKKLEREKRKAESKAKKEAQLLLEKEQLNDENISRLNEEREDIEAELISGKGRPFCVKIFLFILVLFFTLLLIYQLFWDSPPISSENIRDLSQHVLVKVKFYTFQLLKNMKFYFPIIREKLLRIVHQYMVTMTHFANQIEQILSLYF